MAKKATKEEIFAHLEGIEDKSGYEDLNMDTMAVPFIRLLQDLSPQLKKNRPEYIPEAEAGMFVNTISGKLYASPLRVVIGKFERYYIEWGPKRGQFIAVHLPEDVETGERKLVRDENNKLIDPATGNNFQDTYVYYVVLPDFIEEGVCIISFTSSGIKEAKKLNRNLVSTIIPGTNKKALPYFMIWNMECVEMSNDKGDWFGTKFRFDSFVTPNLLENVMQERKELPSKKVDLALLGETTGEEREDDDNVRY